MAGHPSHHRGPKNRTTARCVRLMGCWSGKGVKGSTGSRMRSAGRSPSTERVRMQAKRTLDAAGTIDALVMGVGGFKAVGRPPAPLTTEGDSFPPEGDGRGRIKAAKPPYLRQRRGI